jgi:hypothetical protein
MMKRFKETQGKNVEDLEGEGRSAELGAVRYVQMAGCTHSTAGRVILLKLLQVDYAGRKSLLDWLHQETVRWGVVQIEEGRLERIMTLFES